MKKSLKVFAFHPFESYSYQENLVKLKCIMCEFWNNKGVLQKVLEMMVLNNKNNDDSNNSNNNDDDSTHGCLIFYTSAPLDTRVWL